MICSRCGFSDNGILPGFSCPTCGIVYSSEPKKIIYQHQTPLWETIYAKEYPFTSFFKTAKEIFLNPDQFLKQISSKEHVLTALLFALISGSIGYLFLFLWSQLLPQQISGIFTETESLLTDKNASNVTTLLYTPILITLEILIIALYTHFMLVISRTRKMPFACTLKIVSYSQCALLLNLIPVIGSFFSAAYMIFLLLTGIKQKHGINNIKGFFILALPVIILSTLLLIIIIILVIFGVATSGLIENIAPFLHQ